MALPRVSRDKREKVRHYVLQRLPVKPPVLPKEGEGAISKHHEGGYVKDPSLLLREVHIETAPRFIGVGTHPLQPTCSKAYRRAAQGRDRQTSKAQRATDP
jgi:hypothetical protein